MGERGLPAGFMPATDPMYLDYMDLPVYLSILRVRGYVEAARSFKFYAIENNLKRLTLSDWENNFNTFFVPEGGIKDAFCKRAVYGNPRFGGYPE